MKILNIRITFVIISVLSLLLSPAAKSYAKGTSDNEVQMTVSNNPSLEDANWTIIKTEKHVVTDPSTGQETIITAITRRGPADEDQVPCKDENGSITNDADAVAMPTATCVLGRTSLTQTGTNTVGGGVTGYVKVFANEYCAAGDCDYRKMTKIQLWWTRIGTGWVVRSAYMRWGCNGACAVCPNNTPYTTYRQSGTFTPTWNGLKSTTTTYTRTDWPIMKGTELGDHFGYSRSVAESPSHTTYVLEVWTNLP